MKTVRFQEIIECSSQQSLLTGQAGFGIRTITEGMDEKFANSICEQVNCAYEVDIDKQVTAEEIARDAHIVKKYPRTLRYTTVKDDDGNTKYIVACSTYIGIDYGYFCGLNSARRAGTNYIADILVFDEQPSSQLLYSLVSQHLFLPLDNTCSPDNPELKALLTGEPSYLKPKEITITDYPKEAHAQDAGFIDEQTAFVGIALLQAKLNEESHQDSTLQKVVFQAEEAKVPSILKDFTVLPEELTEGKFFHTNYLQGYGMPKGYHVIFLNENNQQEVYIDNYVYANLDEKTFKNVNATNRSFEQIKEAAIDNNQELFLTFILFALHGDLSFLVQYLSTHPFSEKTYKGINAVLMEYFSQKMNKDMQEGIDEVHQFEDRVGHEAFDSLNLNPLIHQYEQWLEEKAKKAAETNKASIKQPLLKKLCNSMKSLFRHPQEHPNK